MVLSDLLLITFVHSDLTDERYKNPSVPLHIGIFRLLNRSDLPSSRELSDKSDFISGLLQREVDPREPTAYQN